MSNDDSLLRAAKALRNAVHTAPARAKSTRARILMSVNSSQQRRRRRWIAGIPLGVLVLGGSAWAQSSGHLAHWAEALEELSVQLVPDPSFNPLARSGRRSAKLDIVAVEAAQSANVINPDARASDSDELAVSARLGATAAVGERDTVQNAVETLSVATALPFGAQPGAVGVSGPRAAAHSAATPNRRVSIEGHGAERGLADKPAGANARVATSLALGNRQYKSAEPAAVASVSASPAATITSPKLPVPASDPELALFRVAHDLHFKQSAAQESIAAHRAYLARFPNGRFVPEALYNIALDQLRIGDRAAAKRQLEAFASGKYGGYRQREARDLLAAMDGSAHQD